MKKGHIESAQRITDNPFLNMYHLTFHDQLGKPGNYYFVTRNKDSQIRIRTHAVTSEGICIYAVTREENPRLVLVHEYRFPIDDCVYTLPGGLIDAGETAAEAAVREMKEETGFIFHEYQGGSACLRRPFYLVPGFSDEMGSVVFGTIDELPGKQENESTEWIDMILADKKEVYKILREEKTSQRSALLMAAFLRSKPDRPFAFLDIEEEQ